MEDDQYERMVLAALLGGILSQSPMMKKVAMRTTTLLQHFMDKVYEHIDSKIPHMRSTRRATEQAGPA